MLEALLAVAKQTHNTRLSIEILALLAVSQAGQGCDSPSVSPSVSTGPSNCSGSVSAVGSVEQLTARELQVLALLREPLSSKELAAKLDVSHATLKRHVANIYGKLGVTRRWDAVAQAKAIGLLSPD